MKQKQFKININQQNSTIYDNEVTNVMTVIKTNPISAEYL
jgi:hypothetical protein